MARRERIAARAAEELGEQISDQPIEVGIPRPPSIQTMIRESIAHELSRRGLEHGYESIEEADDFEIADDLDDLDFRSQFELQELRDEELPSDTPPGSRPLSDFEERLYQNLQERRSQSEQGSGTPENAPPEASDGAA